MLVLNKARVGAKVVAIKAPGFGDNRKANLGDLASLTGGTVISEDLGLKLEDAASDPSLLGSCSNITISKDDTLMLNGSGEKADIEARCTGIRDQISATKSEYEKEKLQVRGSCC